MFGKGGEGGKGVPVRRELVRARAVSAKRKKKRSCSWKNFSRRGGGGRKVGFELYQRKLSYAVSLPERGQCRCRASAAWYKGKRGEKKKHRVCWRGLDLKNRKKEENRAINTWDRKKEEKRKTSHLPKRRGKREKGGCERENLVQPWGKGEKLPACDSSCPGKERKTRRSIPRRNHSKKKREGGGGGEGAGAE